MKSLLLSHKRNPEDKLDKNLDNKNPEENVDKEKNVEEKEKDKEKEINKEPNNETGLPLDENKEKENKEETNNERKSKKRIKKSLKRNSNKTKDEKQENENKEKDENNNNKQKQTNKSIGDYFLFSGKKEQNNNNTSEENKELNNAENNLNNPDETLIKELIPKDPLKDITNYINKEEIFSLENNSTIKYDTSYLNEIKDIPDKIKSFYSLNSNNITNDAKNDYISSLKNYFSELNTLNNTNNTNTNTKKNKLIFIHNSFAPLKKIPTRESNLINPRNYLAKDEYLIDYEKDSEDEYMEENAEDIKSNDNEDKEEDEEDDINSIQDDKFIVPDGHLSEEELSDKDMMKERQLLENSKENLLGIMSILNIRRNFMKPIVVDFRNKKADDKVNYLMDQLTIGLFKYEDENANNENINTTNIDENNNNINNIYEENDIKPNKVQLSFPIVIGSKVTKYKGIEDSIKIHFEDILRKVHGSYDTKEHLILQLNKKFEDISKKSLNTFFKEKCFKIQKRYWMVNNDTLSQFNIKDEELEQIKKENFNIYKEKEEKRKKELEEIKIKDGIIQPPPNPNEEIKEENNDESHISQNNNTGEKNDKEGNGNENNNNDNNNIKSKSKSRSKNGELKTHFKSRTKSRKRNDISNEGYKMKAIDVLFKEGAEALKNTKQENDNNNKETNQESQTKKKETLKIYEIVKMTAEERQKDLHEIPLVNFIEEENEEKKDNNEENKKQKRKRKENKEKIKKAKSKEPTRNKSKSKRKSKSKSKSNIIL